MNFTALQTEFVARGFDYLADGSTGQTRIKQWINDAYHEICEAADWPFLETTATPAAAPVTLTDLRKVLTVHDATTHLPLRPTNRKWIVTQFGDVASTTGSPRFYYVENQVVRAYPVSGTLTVYYLKFPTDLSGGTDTPVIPTRYHDLIVHGAVRRAYEDQDNFQAAQGVMQEFETGLTQMRNAFKNASPLPDLDDQAQAALIPQPVTQGQP